MFFILLFGSFRLLAQEDETPKQLFVEAESSFLFEEYKEALPLYQKILRAEPNNYNVIYKIGICYLNDIYQKGKAVKYLEEASQHTNPDCNPNSFKEKTAPTDAYYYLGRAYHMNNFYDKAIESYQIFKKSANPAAYDLSVVEEDIAACRLAKQSVNSPIFFSVKGLEDPINTRFEESNPVLSGDGKTLAFTRKLPFYDAVFITRKNSNGQWSEPENITPSLGLDGSSYTTGISYSGDEIFVYRSDNFDGNIYSSKYKNNQWTKLSKLNEFINTKFWESHASISHDGQYLIFTSNRDGGYGGLDIYKSRRSINGEWGPAVNMGPVLNSPANEETPFLSNNGHTIFFSSEGHNTFGGYDIFISNLRSDGTWNKPKNMGYPLNTTSDDIFFSPTGVTSFGLYAAYYEDAALGLMDIYQVEVYNELIPRIFTLEGSIKHQEKDFDSYNELKVLLYDAQTKKLIMENALTSDGRFSLQASQGEYILTVEGKGIKPIQEKINLSLNQPNSIIKLQSLLAEKSIDEVAPLITESSEKEIIQTKNDFFAVTDGSTIPIELTIPNGADLHIEIQIGDSIIKIEDIKAVRKKFTYFYTPIPGENLLKFSANNSEGNSSQTQVIVTYYNPPSEVITEEKATKEKSELLNSEKMAVIATGKLADYLSTMKLSEYSDYIKLYDHLLSVADKEGFSKADIQRLFSVFFTQRDIDNYTEMLTNEYSGNDSLLLKASGSATVPLEFLNRILADKIITGIDLDKLLISIISREGTTGTELFMNLTELSGSSELYKDLETENITPQQAWELFASEQDDKQAGYNLKLISTTDDRDFFYHRLLLSSAGSLNEYLRKLQFESLGLKNSIMLSEFLFSIASDTTFTTAELIEALQNAAANKQGLIESFAELLTDNATGSLKSQLLLNSDEIRASNSFEAMLNYVLTHAQFNNYTRENVYDLILGLIGIEDVKEFAAKIKEYGYLSINQAISDTSIQHFSSPLELVQYLLMATHTYDFTETDINNLLLRMMLENGMKDRISKDGDKFVMKFWKSKKFLPTVILVNIVLIILIILFTLRRKRNDQQENKSKP